MRKKICLESWYMYLWKYSGSIMDYSDLWWSYGVIGSRNKNYSNNFNEMKATCKTQNFYLLLAFLSTTIALLIAVIIYCYLIILIRIVLKLINSHTKVLMYTVNLLYLIYKNINGYFEEINKSKYLTLVLTNESKEKIWKTLD